MQHIALLKALVSAWDTYKDNARFFLMVPLILSLVILGIGALIGGAYASMFSSYPSSTFSIGKMSIALFPSSILIFIARELYLYQLLYFCLRIYAGEKLSWQSFFVLPSGTFLLFFAARIRYIAVCFLGLLLFIIPGIAYACSNYFAGYSIMHSLTDSLKKDALISSMLTTHNRWRILLFMIITSLIQPLGFLYLFTMPLIVLITLELYKQLLARHTQTIEAIVTETI